MAELDALAQQLGVEVVELEADAKALGFDLRHGLLEGDAATLRRVHASSTVEAARARFFGSFEARADAEAFAVAIDDRDLAMLTARDWARLVELADAW